MAYFNQIQLKDPLGNVTSNTPLQDLRVAEVTRIVGSQFSGTVIDPNFWTSTVSNAATITQTSSEISLISGTNTAGSAQLNSVRKGRVIAGISQQWRGGIQVNNIGIANNVRIWGIAWGANMPTISDAAYFKLNGTTFQVATLKGGVETAVSSGSFNGEVTSYIMTTNTVVYEIYYSQTQVQFVIGGVLVHTVSASVSTWTNDINQHCYMSNVNAGNTTSVTLEARFSVIRRFGKQESVPTYARISTATTSILKYGSGLLHKIVINNPSNNSITVYDNIAASGAIIAVINPGSSPTPFLLDYHLTFQNGLTIVTAGAPDLTVVYE